MRRELRTYVSASADCSHSTGSLRGGDDVFFYRRMEGRRKKYGKRIKAQSREMSDNILGSGEKEAKEEEEGRNTAKGGLKKSSPIFCRPLYLPTS